MNDGKGPSVNRKAIAIIGYAHRQHSEGNQQAHVAAVVEHAHRQARREREDRTEGYQRTDQRHRHAQVIEERRYHRRCRVALNRHRHDRHQELYRAEFHIFSLILQSIVIFN
jgi:hypothetical protein